MSNKRVEMDKMAMAIQHAVHLMRGAEYGTEVLNLGIQLSINILLPLTAELALKGLKQKETTPDGFTRACGHSAGVLSPQPKVPRRQ